MSDQFSILIVEDDPIIADLYQKRFVVDGFDVTLAGDGQVAIDLLKKSKPDAVLLDLMLPQVNGIEVVKFIRADDKLKKLPVIIFTNAYLGNMVQAAWKAGADKCLTKAICKPSQVVQLVRATIEERGGHAGTRKSKAAKPHSAGKGGSDEDDFRRRFLVDSPQILSEVRTRLQAVVKSETDTAYLHWLEERSNLLKEMYHVLHSLTGKAGAAGFGQVAQLSSALEAMLQELADTPQNTSSSVLRTFAHAVDFLALILSGTTPAALNEHEKPVALLVDDEVFSRRAVISGLEKVGLSYVSMSSPAEALEVLDKQTFDLIFLDIDMPEMDGFTLCENLRKNPAHKNTPVIFVTGLNDFQVRAKSSLAGGNDIIGKPFLPIELAVKALTHLYKNKKKSKSKSN